MTIIATEKKAPSVEVASILEARLQGEELDEVDIRALLTAEDYEDAFALVMQAACEMRRRHFGSRVFLYGFVYFSTYCRNDCGFCYYGRSNDAPPRYRKSVEETVEIARHLAESGVHLIDLTMGEDPLFLSDPQLLPSLVGCVRRETGLAVMVSPGVVDRDGLNRLAAQGADWYALYQETFSPALFARWRTGQSSTRRLEAKRQALDAGLLVEEGLMCGLGESRDDLVIALRSLQAIEAAQVRVMTFIPQQGTPLQDRAALSARRELLLIAIMRLMFPDRLIPASLDVEGVAGLAARLDAGANVITSIIPPHEGLAGVANAYEGIADGTRTVASVEAALQGTSLEIASAREYRTWVEARKCAHS